MELNKVNRPYYNDYGTWIRSRFPFRVQKISVDAATIATASASSWRRASSSLPANTPT